jgi:hypothetical protein
LKFDWKNIDNKWYYYREDTGRIVGVVHFFALQTICNAYIYDLQEPYIFCERSLGIYVSMESAKMAVEDYWLKETQTLIAE